MRLVFVYYIMDDAGSAQDIANYSRAARELGHEIVVYGPVDENSSFDFSQEIGEDDALVFVFEWTTGLRFGDNLDLSRLLSLVPRERRVVIDCDGAYNKAITVGTDYNHRSEADSTRWRAVCESLADKICQPALHPAEPNVRSFLFHAYDERWEQPLDFSSKDYGMVYVGHSKFRWEPMHRVLKAIEPVRPQVGRIAFVGHGWDALPHWAEPMGIEDQFFTDKEYLGELGAEFVAPVPFEEVIPWMSRGIFSPVVYRPLFSHLGLVTCRTFETPAASTIPLFNLDWEYVKELYGEDALELVLDDETGSSKIMDIVSRPEHYADIVVGIRRHLAEKHSHTARLRELIKIVES